jgi:hypothetical protein
MFVRLAGPEGDRFGVITRIGRSVQSDHMLTPLFTREFALRGSSTHSVAFPMSVLASIVQQGLSRFDTVRVIKRPMRHRE